VSKFHESNFLQGRKILSSEFALDPYSGYDNWMAILRFHVVPNAKTNEVTGEHGGAIKIKLRAPAREGKANAALRSFLAQELRISQSAIVPEHGEKSRDKLIRIDGLSEEEVRASLFRTKESRATR
jgi:uncharacterized protein